MSRILINSVPKSGTNLVAGLLEILGYKYSGHIGSGLVRQHSWRAKVRSIVYRPILSPGLIIGVDTPVELKRSRIFSVLRRCADGRFLTAHSGYTDDLLFQARELDYKLLLIVRDPRAVLNSFVHYACTNKKHFLYPAFNMMRDPIEQYSKALNGFSYKGVCLNSLATRFNALNNWLHSESVLTIKFEELIGSRGNGSDELQSNILEGILDHIGIAGIPRGTIIKIQDSLFAGRKNTFRRGTIDSWAVEMPRSIRSYVNEHLAGLIESLGYST